MNEEKNISHHLLFVSVCIFRTDLLFFIFFFSCLPTDIHGWYSRFMAVNIILCVVYNNNKKRSWNSIRNSNNDSNNNNKSANIFYELHFVVVLNDIFALFLVWISAFATWTWMWAHAVGKSTSRSSSTFSISLCVCADINSENAFCIALLWRFVCALILPFCHYTISITDLFFNWLCFRLLQCSQSHSLARSNCYCSFLLFGVHLFIIYSYGFPSIFPVCLCLQAAFIHSIHCISEKSKI